LKYGFQQVIAVRALAGNFAPSLSTSIHGCIDLRHKVLGPQMRIAFRGQRGARCVDPVKPYQSCRRAPRTSWRLITPTTLSSRITG
jgi:hypothetical protein